MAAVATQSTVGPPGPKRYPLALHLRPFNTRPLSYLTESVRRYGDIVCLNAGKPFDLYLVNSPQLIEQVVVKQHRRFHKTPAFGILGRLLGNGLLTSEGDAWRRERKLAAPAFHAKRIDAYAAVMVDYGERLLAQWQDGATFDVHEAMMALTLEVAAKTLFDADLRSQAESLSDALTEALSYFDYHTSRFVRLPAHWPTPRNRRYDRAVRTLDGVVNAIIAERRQAAADDVGDLLSILLRARDEDGGGMTDQQLHDEVMTILLAGHETTANLMTWTWYLLAQHPQQAERLDRELGDVLGDRRPTVADLRALRYTEAVVLESLRLFPPAWIISRRAIEACELGGYPIPNGAAVIMSQWVMHRDPRYFEQPEQFQPDRWLDGLEDRLPPFAYFPFSGGPRICIGKHFAMMEAVLLLATIRRRAKLTLAPGHPVVPDPGMTLRPKHGMRMTVAKR